MKTLNQATALISAFIGGVNGVDASSFQQVTHSIEQIKTLSVQQCPTSQIFASVKTLAEQINLLNDDMAQHLHHIKPNEFDMLLLVNQAVGYAFHLLKQGYQEEILSTYRNEFKALSNAKNRFENHLREVKETLYGVEIVSLENISLSPSDVEEMMQAIEIRDKA